MSIALWGARILLATVFGLAGLMKLTGDPSEIVMHMPAIAIVPIHLWAALGVTELVGAAGLILPPLFGRSRPLTSGSAGLLAALIALTLPVHLAHGPLAILPMSLMLLGVALFIIRGEAQDFPSLRFLPNPLAP